MVESRTKATDIGGEQPDHMHPDAVIRFDGPGSGDYPVQPVDEPPKGIRRFLAVSLMVVAASIGMAHGLYYTVIFPYSGYIFVDIGNVIIALFVYWTAFEVFKGRRYYFALGSTMLLYVVAYWDATMIYTVWTPHYPFAVYIILPMIWSSQAAIILSRREFEEFRKTRG